MSRQINVRVRSVVVKERLKYLPIIASDKLLGDHKVRNNRIADKGVVVLISNEKDASIRDVCDMVKDYIINKKTSLPPAVVISAGNRDISRKGFVMNHPVSLGKEGEVITSMIDYTMGKLVDLEEFIISKGGILMVAPAIPRPADQCFENCIGIPQWMQKFYSEAHQKLNAKIKTMNEDNGLQTPPIDTYMEKSKAPAQRSTHQKKIYKTYYHSDLIYPLQSKQLKMITTLERAIKGVARN